MLFRLRGQLPPPDAIVIVAVDDTSLQRIGRWPWPRSIVAGALDSISGAQPRAIGLDIIYAEQSDAFDDDLLAQSITNSGRVVLPAQLIEVKPESAANYSAMTWLRPLPEVAAAAAGLGHAHAAPDVDGMLRSIQLSKADDQAHRLWAFGLEVVRVAERIPAGDFEEESGALRFGPYRIPLRDEMNQSSVPGVTIFRPNEMLINYIGPTGSFRQYSIADVLDGVIPPAAFADKIVLIGAVSPSMGDTRVSPFMHYGADRRQGGQEMPGVEVNANIINTIRNRLWLKPVSDWLAFLAALTVVLCSVFAIKWLDGWPQVLSLSAVLFAIILGSLIAFNYFLFIPPLTAMVTGFFSIVPLSLLNRSLAASQDLDIKLALLASTPKGLLLDEKRGASSSDKTAFIGSLLGAEIVTLYLRDESTKAFRVESYYAAKSLGGALPFSEKDLSSTYQAGAFQVTVPIDEAGELFGALSVARAAGEPFDRNEHRLICVIAQGLATGLKLSRQRTLLEEKREWLNLSHNLAWKLRAVDDLTTRILGRMSFMNRVLSSMADGVLVTDMAGQIVFANRQAAQIWNVEPEEMIGASLVEYFVERGVFDLRELREAMKLVVEKETYQREFEIFSMQARYYLLQLSAVVAPRGAISPKLMQKAQYTASPTVEESGTIGLVAILSDITKRRELDQIKTETLQLVSHELRTPLHSIQGLTDVLIKFPVAAGESQEILSTIHSEAVRLSETINRYLDLTRLESGTQPLKTASVSAEQLIAGCVRSIEPLAAEKGIKICQRVRTALPPLLVEAQLFTQAINNLLSNAIKYSPDGSEVTIEAKHDNGSVRIAVRDHGYGIPEGARERIFEKFYRLERDTASGAVGTGLGLPIVKEIVEKHGGSISVESNSEKGSTFTIHLPNQPIKPLMSPVVTHS